MENDTKNKVKILETLFALQELRGYIYFASENNLEDVKMLKMEEFFKFYSFYGSLL